MRLHRFVAVGLFCQVVLFSATSWAQVAGSMTGVVKDTSGAVLPGVTVEAESPALIEKVRTVITDEEGRYRIADLRPGTYGVTFKLPGFGTFKREGLELTTGFAATVDAALAVGSIEETVVVSGLSPVVDIQNVVQQTTLGRATLDSLPSTRRLGNYATILPGAVGDAVLRDVGGNQGESGAQFSIHGNRAGDINTTQDGMNQTTVNGSTFSWNPHTIQEVVLETSGTSAETATGGVLISLVPKDGGNRFSGTFSLSYGTPRLQAKNADAELQAQGVDAREALRKAYDVAGSVGGPIMRDRLWFFTAHRKWGASQYQQGNYFNKLQGTLLYEADPTRPAFTNDYYRDSSIRLTWQVTSKDKVGFGYSGQTNCNCPIYVLNPSGGLFPAPEATGEHHYSPAYVANLTWSRPATSRLLLEAGTSLNVLENTSTRLDGVGPDDIGITDQATNRSYGSRAINLGIAGSYSAYRRTQTNTRFAMSYITGSHNFKTGFNLQRHAFNHKNYDNFNAINQAVTYRFRSGVPNQVTIWATPWGSRDRLVNTALFVQDQWTRQRLTANLGLRYDAANGNIPSDHLQAGQWVPARDFPAAKDTPDFKNLSPRLGAAYDLFGNAKTALKVSLGRYASFLTAGIGSPASAQPASASRTWNDRFFGPGDPRTGNFVPDCVLGPNEPKENGECGALSDSTFGVVKEGNTRYADDALKGFGQQGFSWQTAVAIQQELRPGTALNVGYYRTWYGNFTVTDNQYVTPADYDQYCITAPVDPELPGGGGNTLCELYDVDPDLFGKIDNVVTQASHFGEQTEVYNGVDATVNSRFGNGGQFSGGVSVGQTSTDNCFAVDVPARSGFCKVTNPWEAGAQVKFLIIYPLPWKVQASATYQNIPGIPVTASYVASNAQIVPTLHRSLAAGPNANATIELIPNNSIYLDRMQQVDVRFARPFRFGRVTVRANADLYNLFNANSVLAINTRYGPEWLNARQILAGRLLKFGLQVDF